MLCDVFRVCIWTTLNVPKKMNVADFGMKFDVSGHFD